MSTKAEAAEFRFDGLKWLVVFALIVGGVFANSYYAEQVTLLLRVIGLVACGLLAAAIAVQTAKGRSFWQLLKEAQIELRKVIWPSNAETNQTTMLVSLVVIIAAIILWMLDWGIGRLAKFLIGS